MNLWIQFAIGVATGLSVLVTALALGIVISALVDWIVPHVTSWLNRQGVER